MRCRERQPTRRRGRGSKWLTRGQLDDQFWLQSRFTDLVHIATRPAGIVAKHASSLKIRLLATGARKWLYRLSSGPFERWQIIQYSLPTTASLGGDAAGPGKEGQYGATKTSPPPCEISERYTGSD